MNKPITPGEVIKLKAEELDDRVFACFNSLIARHWDGQQSSFKLADAERLVCSVIKIQPAEAYAKKLFDVEEIYRNAGWVVEFDKPGFNETYPATYKFRKKR